MKCVRCDQEIEGEISRCNEGCMCGGKQGRITKDGLFVGRINGDEAVHVVWDFCLAAMKHRIAALEAHT